MKKYVLGFAFDRDKKNVLLVRKKRPVWMRGMLNGIGGKVEDGETPWDAMGREYYEECELNLTWFSFATMNGIETNGEPFEINVYRANENIDFFKQKEDEQIEIYHVEDVVMNRLDGMMADVPMLVSMAISDCAFDDIAIYL